MPSFKYPDPVAPKTPSTVAVADKEYSHSIVDTKQQPLNSLVTRIAGSSRDVDYYSQVLSGAETPQTYSVNLAPHLQQYRLIEDFEIKQQDFDYSFSDETNEVSGSGSALIYPPLIPNIGDVFIADIGDGRVGLFSLTRVEKKSIFKQACYEIAFNLLNVITSKDFVDVLNQKVVETYHFVKDFILYGQNPLLVKEDYLLLNDSMQILDEAIEDYLTEFYSRELCTLVVPGYSRPTYDPFVVKAFMTVVDSSEHHRARLIKMKNTDELKEFWHNSIWEALINPSRNQHTSFWGRAKAVPVTAFNMHPRINSIRFSGFDLCMRPLDKLENVDTYYQLNVGSQAGFYGWFNTYVRPITASGSIMGQNRSVGKACWCKVQDWYHAHHDTLHPWDPMNHLSHISQYNHTCHDPDCPCVCHSEAKSEEETTLENSYIFSPDFWKDSITSTDAFEQVVKQHLSLKTVDSAIVNKLLKERRSWTHQERFYKMLVLIIILVASIRSI